MLDSLNSMESVTNATDDGIAVETSQVAIANELPDELLDKIIRDVGPPYRSPLPPVRALHKTGRSSWLPCSLVCRRWRRVAIPYIFRFVSLNKKSPGSLEDFLGMLSRDTVLVQVIESIYLCVRKLHMDTLAALLQRLPRLRYLRIFTRLMVFSESGERAYGHHRLEYLAYECRDGDTDTDFVGEVTQLVRLFDDIGELELGSGGALKEAYGPSEDSPLVPGRLHIHSLKLATFEYFGPPLYLTVLSDAHALDSLTSLSVWITSLTKMSTLNETLLSVGSTLHELFLYFELDGDEDTFEVGREIAITQLRSGLAACTALHALRIKTDSTFAVYSSVDLSLDMISGYAVNDWLLAFEIFALVTEDHASSGRIRHLAFWYESHGWRHEDQGFEILPWGRMRHVLRRFVNLTSLTVFFDYPYDDEGPLDIDGAELTAEEYTRREMHEFEGILHYRDADSFFNCAQQSCRWHTVHSAQTVDPKFDTSAVPYALEYC